MAKSGGRKRRPQGCSLRSHRLRRLKPLTPTLSPATHSAIPSMLPCCTSDLKRRDEIVTLLRNEGHKSTTTGKPITPGTIKWLRYKHRIQAPQPPEGSLNVRQVRERYRVSLWVVHYWIDRGIIPALQRKPNAPYARRSFRDKLATQPAMNASSRSWRPPATVRLSSCLPAYSKRALSPVCMAVRLMLTSRSSLCKQVLGHVKRKYAEGFLGVSRIGGKPGAVCVPVLSGKELARCRTLRLGPFPAPPHQNCS